MREYVLTEKERETIEKFLKDRAPSDLINVLRFRAKQHLAGLKKDLELLQRLIES